MILPLKSNLYFFSIVIIFIVNLIILIIIFNLSAQVLIFFNRFLKNILFFNLLMITINNNNNNNNNNSLVAAGQVHGSPGLGRRPSLSYVHLLQNLYVGQKRTGGRVCTQRAGLQTLGARFCSPLK